MANKLVLSYRMKNDKFPGFFDFCKNGLKDPQGKPIKVNGARVSGVISWMVGEELCGSNFFCNQPAAAGTEIKFAVICPPSLASWSKILKFRDFIDADLHLTEAEARALGSVPELDEKLNDQCSNFSKLPADVQRFLKPALRQEKDTDIEEAIAQLEAKDRGLASQIAALA